MSNWQHKSGSATISVNREAFSAALAPLAGDLNQVAAQVAEEARNKLPTEAMRKFISFKPAGRESGTWRLQMTGRRYGSGTGERLQRGLRVPIALVTNNSNLAVLWEYGGTPQEAIKAVRRPHKAGATKTGNSGELLTRQYQPLTLAAQQVGARLVLRRRVSGGA